MKNLCIIMVLVSCYLTSNAQSFDIEDGEKRMILKPKFEHFSHEGKKDSIFYFDDNYVRNIANEIAIRYLPQECIQLLSERRGQFLISARISTKGKFLYLEFYISPHIFNLLTDDILLEFYKTYKKIVLDMTKSTYNPAYPFDYCRYSFPVYKPIKQDAIP